jgi:hypothetical protein
MAPEFAADLEPIHARHHRVEQDDVAIAPFADFQRFKPAGRRDHVEIFRAQPGFEQPDIGRDVVDHQHAGRHSSGPFKSASSARRHLSPI